MLYRKYRPTKFSEVIGSTHIASTISLALYRGNIAHAFFLYGTRGIGKTTTARLLAKSLNCESPVIDEKSKIPFEPCGECASCKAVESGRHLDLIEIDAASNRGIDSIREIIDKVKLSPAMGKNKVYIIDEVHMLTNEASNALLKTLEEPPEHAYFILCTTNPEKVLDTIKSRCQQFVFKRPTLEEIQQKVIYILENEGRDVPKDLISKIASGAKGAFRDAETLLEQILNRGEDDFVFGSDYGDYINLLVSLNNKDAKTSLEIVQKVLEAESSAEIWTENYIEFLRSVMLYKLGIKDAILLYESSYNAYESDLKDVSVDFLKLAIYQFSKAMEDFRFVAIPSLPVEMATINLCQRGDALEPQKPKQKPIANSVSKSIPLSMPQNQGQSSSQSQSTSKEIEAVKETVVDVIVVEEEEIVRVEVEKTPAKIKYLKEFPFKKMCTMLKETNHSIYLLLGTATVDSFEEGILRLKVPYSFHKERLLSSKIRATVEEVATELAGGKVILECTLKSSSKDAADLTDNNIKSVKKDVPLEKVFEDVFGDDIV